MEYILSFEWLIKHPISIPFFFLVKEQVFKHFVGGMEMSNAEFFSLLIQQKLRELL